MRPSFPSITTIVTSALALSVISLASASAQQPSVAVQTIAVMNKLWGSHPGMRANHAKGVVTTGYFTPSKTGAALSIATIFTAKHTPVTVRFSDGSGLPTIADGSAGANPHGMSVKFMLPDGKTMDMVDNSLKFFPVATGAEFMQLLQAVSESGPTAPKPTPIATFFASHPAAPLAFASVQTPVSFANETYNGVDAFVFINKAGQRQPFRTRIVPFAGDKYLTPAAAAKQSPDYLVDGLATRLKKAPIRFHLMAQLASPADPIDDATKPWPASDKLVDLGTITITKIVADNAAAQAKLFYLPSNLMPGIEPSADPLILARDQAYAVSYGKRQAH